MTVHRSDRPLLEIQDLRTHFFTQDGTVKAVDGVSYEIGDGKTVGVVGESGCGKSITALPVMRLTRRPGRMVGGSVLLRGRDRRRVESAEMRDTRGNQIRMIFQEPMTSLNPVYTCGDQISEAVSLHEAVGRRQAWERAVEMLQLVGIPDPARRAKQYPHELSGGMRQRVMIAMALSTNPELLIAAEQAPPPARAARGRPPAAAPGDRPRPPLALLADPGRRAPGRRAGGDRRAGRGGGLRPAGGGAGGRAAGG